MKFSAFIGLLGSMSLALPIAAPVFAQEPPYLATSSKWVVDFGEDRCRALRTFGDAGKPMVLLFELYHPSDSFRWLISGSHFKKLRTDQEVAVQFGPAFEPSEAKFAGATFGEYGKTLQGYGVEPSEVVAEIDPPEHPIPEALLKPSYRLDPREGAQIEWIQVEGRGIDSFRLSMDGIDQVYAAMNSCLDSLVSSWGLDPKLDQQRVSSPTLINSDDVYKALYRSFPTRAQVRGEQADLHMRVMVGADGKAIDCVITNMSLAKNFDDSACDIIRDKARFEPARDVEGNAIPSYYALNMSYRIG